MVTCPSCYRKCNLKENLVDPSELMEHFNLDEHGVKILDKSLATSHSPTGMIADIFFKDKKAWCELCDSSDCKHIEYALSLGFVQEILKKKGWKLP
jgi:hypothetical protein